MAGLEDDINIIKSLIAISKGGLLLSKVEWEYRDMTGGPLSYRKYGYKSLSAMLESSGTIVLRQTQEGIVCQVHDEKMSHVTSLVDRTKSQKEKKKKKHGFNTKGRNSYHSMPRNYSSSYRAQRPGHNIGNSYSSRDSSRRQPFQPSNRMSPMKGSISSVPTQVLASCSANRSQTRSPVRRVQSAITKPANPNVQRAQENLDHSPKRFPPVNTIHGSNLVHQFKEPRSTMQSCHGQSLHNTQRSQSAIQSQSRACFSGTNDSESYNTSVCKRDIKESLVKSSSGSDWSSGSSVLGQNKKEILSRANSNSSWSSASNEVSSGNKVTGLSDNGQNSSRRLVKSSSNSSWSSSSSSSGLDRGHKVLDSRTVEIPKSNHVNDKEQCIKISSSQLAVSNLSVTFFKNSCSQKSQSTSDSEWSSDPSDEESDRANQRRPKQVSPPLMVGGVGRGKPRAEFLLRKPGSNCKAACNSKPLYQRKEGLAITGTPNKRDTVATLINGQKTIVVKVPNTGAKSVQDVIKATLEYAEPSYRDFQFIGDFFLLCIAEVCLGSKIKHRGQVSYCGLCQNNLTISECLKSIEQEGVSGSGKIVLMIGMTDILQGATIQEMKDRMLCLLKRLKHLNLILLSLPVPPSFIKSGNERKLSVLEAYNKWLLELPSPLTVVDVDRHLYSDSPFYKRSPGSKVETFSDGGCWIVMDEIIAAIDSRF